MRLVKCKDTGLVGIPSDFYKAENGKYYETKQGYEKKKQKVNITIKYLN